MTPTPPGRPGGATAYAFGRIMRSNGSTLRTAVDLGESLGYHAAEIEAGWTCEPVARLDADGCTHDPMEP